MKTYQVTFRFSAFKSYIVRAEDEDEANREALRRFDRFSNGVSMNRVGMEVANDPLETVSIDELHW